MPKQISPRKTQAATAQPLSLPPVIDKRQAVDVLLEKLFEMALKGDLSAMKLYLDFQLKRGPDEPQGITTEDALKLMNQQNLSLL